MNQEYVQLGASFKDERMNIFDEHQSKQLDADLGDNLQAIEEGFWNLVSAETLIKYTDAIGLDMNFKRKK